MRLREVEATGLPGGMRSWHCDDEGMFMYGGKKRNGKRKRGGWYEVRDGKDHLLGVGQAQGITGDQGRGLE